MYMVYYLKYLYLLFTRPIVQHPLSIAFVAPVMLLLPDAKCPLLPMDDSVTIDPLFDGITATTINKRNINDKRFYQENIKSVINYDDDMLI